MDSHLFMFLFIYYHQCKSDLHILKKLVIIKCRYEYMQGGVTVNELTGLITGITVYCVIDGE